MNKKLVLVLNIAGVALSLAGSALSAFAGSKKNDALVKEEVAKLVAEKLGK